MFNPSILQHSRIGELADEAGLNKVLSEIITIRNWRSILNKGQCTVGGSYPLLTKPPVFSNVVLLYSTTASAEKISCYIPQ